MTGERDAWLSRLDGSGAGEAVATIRSHPEWMRGEPPAALTRALRALTYDAERPLLDLARDWERGPLVEALWRELEGAETPAGRAHVAWLIKALPGKEVWERAARAGTNPEEALPVRVFLLDALDRLAFANAIGWHDLKTVIELCRTDSQPVIRERVPGMLMSLPVSHEGTEVLLSMLEDEQTSVMTAALQALESLGVRTADPRLARITAPPNESIRGRAKRIAATTG